MSVTQSLRQLDRRVLGPPENDRKRVERRLPVYLGLALVLQGLAATTDGQRFEGAVFWLVAASFSHALALGWWRREP